MNLGSFDVKESLLKEGKEYRSELILNRRILFISVSVFVQLRYRTPSHHNPFFLDSITSPYTPQLTPSSPSQHPLPDLFRLLLSFVLMNNHWPRGNARPSIMQGLELLEYQKHSQSSTVTPTLMKKVRGMSQLSNDQV